MRNENIVVVNEKDECIGFMDKLLVHRNGILHRAFSVLLFDREGNMLIQKRSKYKYHSPSLWANACCSHQRAGESLDESLGRRLFEELGICGVLLREAFVLRYSCTMPNSLVENEIDHVFFGRYQGLPVHFNRDEIEEVDSVSFDFLKKAMDKGDAYAYWFRLIVKKIMEAGNPAGFS